MSEPKRLVKFEESILRECAGLAAPTPWNAEVGKAIEALRGNSYIDRQNRPTKLGWEYLDDMLIRD